VRNSPARTSRLDAERSLSRQLQEDLEAALDRKTALKEEVADLTSALEATRREAAGFRSQLAGKADLLTQVEGEVRLMNRTHCQAVFMHSCTFFLCQLNHLLF